MWGLETKDVLGVLLVPVGVAVLGVVVPLLQAHRRRRNFEKLVRRELEEAAPVGDLSSEQSWHHLLSKRFLHQKIITSPEDACEFVMSLNADFAYYLGQMWMNFDRAEQAGTRSAGEPFAREWCYFLKETCVKLDRVRMPLRRRRPNLTEAVWLPWSREIDWLYGKPRRDGAERSQAAGLHSDPPTSPTPRAEDR